MSLYDREYRTLTAPARKIVDQLADELLRRDTGFVGRIDPHAQPVLAAQWIACRDSVMANIDRFAELMSGSVKDVQSLARAIWFLPRLDSVPGWIDTARGELGVHEIAGAHHNPKIMGYIHTCLNIQQTAAQRRYVEREGEEGVEWCSAFVNWCLGQNGVLGTADARASSWQTWGIPLSGPQRGAVVGFGWRPGTHVDHVAFCDELDGKFYMLGGNQLDAHSGGQVSRVAFPKAAARFYRWPAAVA